MKSLDEEGVSNKDSESRNLNHGHMLIHCLGNRYFLRVATLKEEHSNK